jgi:DNA-directed RNA polymerase subunit RPC12/RpoP
MRHKDPIDCGIIKVDIGRQQQRGDVMVMEERKPVTRLSAFFKAFGDERPCEEYLISVQYPNGFICPKCGNTHYGWIHRRKGIQCTSCSHQVSLTANTVMHGSHIPLRKWLLAIFLITHDKRGCSAMTLAHEVKVTRKSAAYLLQRLRSVMALEAIGEKLDGWVEIDDAYIGPKGPVRGRGTAKASFIVAVEKVRDGGVCIRATNTLKAADYKLFALDHICRTSRITSDGFLSIRAGLSAYGGHEPAVFDGQDEVRSLPTVHHIISNFKAHIAGTYHGVRKDYLQSYMDEFSYRYNNRRNIDVFHTFVSDVCFSIKRARPVLTELFRFQDVSSAKVAA